MTSKLGGGEYHKVSKVGLDSTSETLHTKDDVTCAHGTMDTCINTRSFVVMLQNFY